MGILFRTKALTGVEAYERRHDPDLEDSPPPEVLRIGYRLAVGALLALAIVLAPTWLPAAATFAWSHWPWLALLPVVLFLAFIAEEFEYGAPYLVAACGLLAALQLDGLFSTTRLLSSDVLGLPVFAWILALAAIAVTTWLLGSVDRHEWSALIWTVLGGLAAVALAYVVYRALANSLTPDDFRHAGRVLRHHWPPIALAASLVLLAARFMAALRSYGYWYEYSSRYYLDPDYYDPDYLRDDEQTARLTAGTPAGSNSRSAHSRAQWLIRVIAAVRNTGLNVIDATLMLVTLVLFAITILYYVPDQLVGNAHLSATAAAKSRAEERRTALAMLAALGAGFTLVYTHLRHQLDRDASTSTRFTDGVTNMATEALSTRLGGIYSLGQVARQSPRYADNVVEVLSAFTCESTADRATSPTRPVTPVTLASLRVLNDTPPASREPDLPGIDLSHATLDDLRCRPKTNLADANFLLTRVNRAILERAVLVRANLRESHWDSANLRRAKLDSADLDSVTMTRCNLDGANLHQATLRDAHLSEVNLDRANLFRADLRGAVLTECSLRGAHLNEADLRGCDLSSCHVEVEDIWGPVHDDQTRWPPGVDIRELSNNYGPDRDV